MKLLAAVLFTPNHMVLLLPMIMFLIAAQIAHIAGLLTPDYQGIGALITFSYFASVAIELRAHRRR